MNASPRPRRNATVRRTTSRFVVLLGDEDGNAPAAEDEVDYLSALKISRTASGSRIDTITLRYDLAKAGVRLVDTTAPVGFNRQIEVRRLDEDGEPTIIVGWGFLAIQNQTLDASTEAVTLEARLDRFVFGGPLETTPCSNPDELYESIDARRPWVFNPQIDERIEGNMGTRRADDEHGEYRYFIDPESVRTQPAKDVQSILSVEKWTLPEAVLTLCWHLNRDQEWIINPTREELETVFEDFSGEDLLRDHRLKLGGYLPELLDDLLRPYGFGWYLEHGQLEDPDDERETSLRFYRRGEGDLVSLKLQRPGESIDATKTNLSRLDVNYNIAELANVITVQGHSVWREITAPLVKGWPTSDDSLDLFELERGKPDAEEHPYAFRKWVLNEAGDYNGTRPEIAEAFDLSNVFAGGPILVRRRKLLKTISTYPAGDDENSFGVFVEWWNSEADGAVAPDPGERPDRDDPGWERVKWPFSVLEKECGILFNGPLPPDPLSNLGDQAFVRVTAVLESDSRITHTVDRRDSSPNGRDLKLVLDLPHKFHDRALHTGDDLESIFVTRPHGDPDTKDDTERIQRYAEDLQKSEDCAEVSVSVTLEGADHAEYTIGKLIEKIDGRNLILDANNPDEGEPRRLQIVGHTLHLDQQQRMELLLETFALERSDLAEVYDLR